MKPPYQITNRIIELVASVAEKVGEVNASYLYKPRTELRRKNRIRTIQSSLGLEGNSLSIDQVTAILDKKRIIAPQKEIMEVKNAVDAYKNLKNFNATSLASFCKAHSILMNGLTENAGKIRTKSVGIIKGATVTHIAPPGNIVKSLVKNLFAYLKKNKELILIKSCVFHYEIEFIHPFMDGNGRMGRLWQTLILKKYSPVFDFLPIESLVKARQSEYYRVLGESDNMGDSSGFIEFMLQIINESLEELLTNQNINLTSQDRIAIFKEKIRKSTFSRKDYLRQFKVISTATASRDLKLAAEAGILEKSGDKRTTLYKFKKNSS